MEDVAADWVGNFDFGSGVGEFTGVAGILEMVEYLVREHLVEYGKGVVPLQTERTIQILDSENAGSSTEKHKEFSGGGETLACESFYFFFGGRNFLSMDAMMT